MRALACLLLAGCAGATCPAPRTTVRDGNVLTLATYNVNFGLAGDAATLRAIRSTHADVIVLQETNAEWERAIREQLAEDYPHMRFEPPGDYPAGGSAILSRFPIERARRSSSPIGWFHAQRAIVATPQGRLQLLNVHLKPPVEGGSVAYGLFTTGPQRAREMRRHLTVLARNVPTLVAGDFNESAGGGLEVLERERSMRDAFDGASCPTWHWNVSSVEVRQQLDHIVHDDRVELVRVWVDARGRSDHFPVIARFRLRSRRRA